MNRMRIKSFLFFLFCMSVVSLYSELVYVDFDVSMQTNRYLDVIQGKKTLKNIGIPGVQVMKAFRSLYLRNNFLTLALSEKPRMPKIIHQIWIGEKVPDKFRAFQQSWIEKHPDWEYRLWTQNDIKAFGFKNLDLILDSRNFGEISDIMRYEILYRFGGVYVDFDFECIQPIDELSHMYDFYIGTQPLDSGLVTLGIGLIGSIPRHPILKHAIDSMKSNWRVFAGDPPKRTGPIYFTRSFLACAGKGKTIDVALPVHYLYPLGWKEFDLKPKQWLREGAFGIHHWSGSWLRPEFRRPEFQEL